MAKQLTSGAIRNIADYITNFDGMPSWSKVITFTKVLTGHPKTQAALYAHPEIKKAWKDKKIQKQVASEDTGRPKSKALRDAENRSKMLQAKIDELEAVNEALVRKFVLWSYNASQTTKFPLTEEILNRPIPGYIEKSHDAE